MSEQANKTKLNTKADREVLPTNVKPLHYELTLTPDLEKFVFQGQVSIKLKINEATSKIVLNANEIEIQKAQIKTLQGKTEQSFDSQSITYNNKDTTATITFSEEFAAETDALLVLDFTGILNDKMNGFYRSSYTDKNGNKAYMATTQFEPADARKAFPCWDEPSLKATFDITLRVPSNLVALSNMNVLTEEPIEGTKLKEVKFATTPIMSTYLLAFIVGDLDYIEAFTTGKISGTPVKCRIYAPAGTSEQGRFALEVCTKTLDLFDEVFGVPYPLPKMDMVAVPDFDAGAMENWGLVTYRTVLLLFDDKNTSTSTKQRIASVVAHELAHQWFGNLVTMEWWSDLWLNEGFATWVGNYAVDKLFPEWDFWTQFVMDDVQRGLTLDAMRSSHPIEVDVRNASEINQIFDAISYSKGASVIRMLNAYLTEDVFLSGIRSYLKKHMYGNASTNDLWKALSDESGQNVSEFMNLWTRQVGYPYLSITEEESSDSKTLIVKQNRFLSTGDVTQEEAQSKWWVPLGLVSENSGDKASNEVLSDKETRVSVGKDDFYKFNFDSNSVFRVYYPLSAIKKLGDLVLKQEVLSARDRLSLLSDSSALAQSGIGSSTDFLELLKYYTNEDNYSVWVTLSSRLNELISVWFEEPKEVRANLESLSRKVFSGLIDKLGWDPVEGEGDLVGMLRALAISRVGQSGDEEIIKEARRRFDLYLNGDESVISADIRGPVLYTVLRDGGAKEYEQVKEKYLNSTVPDQKLSFLSALGYTRVPELIHEALNFAISTEDVRPQDIIYIFSSLGLNPTARRAAWAFIKSHWELLAERYSTNFAILGNLIKGTAGKLASESDAVDVETFFKDKDTSKIQRPLEQTLENIRFSAKWLNRDRKVVEEWLAKNSA